MREFFDNVNLQHLKKVVVRLNNDQIIALPSEDVEVMPAPGPGKIIFPVFSFLWLNWYADYSGIDVNAHIDLQIGTDTIATFDEAVLAGITNLLAGGESAGGFLVPKAAIASSLVYGLSGYLTSDVVNKAINLATTNVLDFGGGHARNNLKVTVFYTEIDVT